VSASDETKKAPSIEELRGFWNGCLVYFFAPVLLVGLGLAGWGYYQDSLGIYADGYLGWGIGLMAIGAIPLVAYLLNRESFLVGIRLRSVHPKQPWLWREDWRTGTVRDRGRQQLVSAWVLAVIVTVALLLVVSSGWGLVLDELEVAPWQIQLALTAIALVPLWLLGKALYVTLRRQRYGSSTLQLKKTPVEPGERLSGRLETTLVDIPQEGMTFRLSCMGFVRRGKSSKLETLWSGTATTDSMRIIPGPSGVTIPIEIAIPVDAKTSASGGSGANYQWRLYAAASVPGIDFFAEFDVPVFRVGKDGRAIDSDVG
jgi:hypothetical protein